MSRSFCIVTLWTAASTDCNVKNTCPGVHRLTDRPDVYYVITREIRDHAAAHAYLEDHGLHLAPDELLGRVPSAMSADGYMISTRVTDPAELAQFAVLMAPGEQLGTVPVRDVAGVGGWRS